MLQLKIKPKAEKELNNLPKKDYYRVLTAFAHLRQDPYLGKKMKGKCDGDYTYRVWPYRIVYRIFNKESAVLIIRVGHRQNVYK